MELLISLVSGAMAANLLAGLMRAENSGFIVTSAAGIAGGLMGWYGLSHPLVGAVLADRTDPVVILAFIGAGVVGGVLMQVVLGAARNMMSQ